MYITRLFEVSIGVKKVIKIKLVIKVGHVLGEDWGGNKILF